LNFVIFQCILNLALLGCLIALGPEGAIGHRLQSNRILLLIGHVFAHSRDLFTPAKMLRGRTLVLSEINSFAGFSAGCPLMGWSGRAPAPQRSKLARAPKTRSTPCLANAREGYGQRRLEADDAENDNASEVAIKPVRE
jgi:hypothetical protein